VRIAHLIRSHAVAPEAVLAITFTNKAAEEMAERLDALLGAHDARRVTVKTFHAFGCALARRARPPSGDCRPTLPSPATTSGGQSCAQAVPSLSDSDASRALERIADAKNHLRNLEQIGADDGDFALFFRAYCEALAASQMVDFDDLIALAVRLLDEHPVVRQAIHARYRWISVDEYQDVNLAQVQMLRLLSAGGANLCAIGDPDQAIYGFRGADRRHFLAFQEEHPNARTILLRQSYRAPQSLLNAASQVIARSSDPDADHGARRMWSEFTEQVKLDIHRVASDKAEAETVVQRIEQMVGGTSYFSLDSGRVDETATAVRSFADFAVLYRLNTQSAALIEAFERSGMPYQAPAQTRLAEFKDVQEVLAYLWLLHNPRTRLHIEQVMTAGRVTRPPAQLIELIDAWDGDLTELFARSSRLDALSGSSANDWRRWLASGASLGNWWTVAAWSKASSRCIVSWCSSAALPLSATTQERIQQLMLRAASYGQNQATFLERMTLQGETDAYDPRADRVALLTLHAAKGLEFPVVFIVGCEEGLLPYLPAGRPHDVEEERRLFYVGMTRAQHKLILTHARRRLLFGQEVYAAPSRFIDDIEHALKEIQAQGEQRLRSSKEDLQLRLFT
jgi:DNA helicase-2/ATP-dependent DNA helicase PcrA